MHREEAGLVQRLIAKARRLHKGSIGMSPVAQTAGTALHRYVAAYLAELQRFSYGELRLLQAPPHASVAYGGGGVAYALLRAGEALEDPGLLTRSWRWTSEAQGDARRRGAFDVEDKAAPPVSRRALFYGKSGLQAVRARIARARGRRAEADAALDRYVRGGHLGPGEPLDLVGGLAGQLAGATWLLRRGQHAGLERWAARAARVLEERVARWRPKPTDTGLAHGWPGLVFALLGWSASPGAVLVEKCRELAALPPVYGLEEVPGQARTLPTSWCNGSAGMTLLWVRLAEVAGEERFVRAAEAAAEETATAPADGIPTLCCGAGGRAYALLAMERLQPGRWRRRAEEQALAAIASAGNTVWPNGLLRGHPGLVCLALDLLHPGGGFPLLED